MTNEEIKKILENHKHWLNEDVDGWQLMRADLTGANLEDANLVGADFRLANLKDADLRGADLRDADLRSADLERAHLEGADFRLANLKDAELKGAYLRDADLRSAENVPFIPMTCPNEGAFIGWKKAIRADGDLCIIKLYIPEDAKRSSATGRKCRCNKAKVLSIEGMTSGLPFETAVSIYDKSFIYRIGENIEVNDFDEDRFNECAPGIHFFINKQEAIEY